jgi:tellurite resistance protein TehA-like permease
MALTPATYLFLRDGSVLLFYILVLLVTLFTIAIVYHWFRYGESKRTNILSLAVHLSVCAVLFISMSVIIQMMSYEI